MSRRRRRHRLEAQREKFTSPKRLSVVRRDDFSPRLVVRRLRRTSFLPVRFEGAFDTVALPPRRVVRDSERLTRSRVVPDPVTVPSGWAARVGGFPIGFAGPRREERKRPDECSRRSQRREVLHALRRVGRGHGGGPRRPKSEVSC